MANHHHNPNKDGYLTKEERFFVKKKVKISIHRRKWNYLDMYFRLQLEDQSVYPQQVTKHQWDTFVDAIHINYIANNSKLILKHCQRHNGPEG